MQTAVGCVRVIRTGDAFERKNFFLNGKELETLEYETGARIQEAVLLAKILAKCYCSSFVVI
jgi:hypothetical protein